MHKQFHEHILRAALAHFELPKQTMERLCEYTVVPDEMALEKTVGFELPEASNPLDSIKNAISWTGNALVQYGTWAYSHGSEAPEQFMRHFIISYDAFLTADRHSNREFEDGLRNLGYALHYATDTGTPFHSKPISESITHLLEKYLEHDGIITEDQGSELLSEFLWFISMLTIHHQEFENKLLDDWNDLSRKKEYEAAISNGVSDAMINVDASSRDRMIVYMRQEITGLRMHALGQYGELDKIYRGMNELEEMQEISGLRNYYDRVTTVGLECTYQITLFAAKVLSIFFDRAEVFG